MRISKSLYVHPNPNLSCASCRSVESERWCDMYSLTQNMTNILNIIALYQEYISKLAVACSDANAKDEAKDV